jgi:hypothetical protein
MRRCPWFISNDWPITYKCDCRGKQRYVWPVILNLVCSLFLIFPCNAINMLCPWCDFISYAELHMACQLCKGRWTEWQYQAFNFGSLSKLMASLNSRMTVNEGSTNLPRWLLWLVVTCSQPKGPKLRLHTIRKCHGNPVLLFQKIHATVVNLVTNLGYV